MEYGLNEDLAACDMYEAGDDINIVGGQRGKNWRRHKHDQPGNDLTRQGVPASIGL